jgi:hypothetical protein
MSHFGVMVIGDEPEKQLAPYHEFECTGRDDQYIQDIDKTDELRKDFAEATTTRLRAPDGTLHSFFDERGNWRPEFSRPEENAPTWDKGRRTYFAPPGYEKVEVPTKDVESFAEYIEGWSGQKIVPFGTNPDLKETHKFGYVLLDAAGEVTKVIDRTNPNKKWDWHLLGGRWTGFFRLKQGRDGLTGKPGLMTAAAEAGRADQARKGDIDFDGMRDEEEQKAREKYRRFFGLIGDAPFPQTFAALREEHPKDIEAARKAYWAQLAIERIKGDDELRWIDDVAEEFRCTEDVYAQRARDRAVVCFALVKDSQWYERGEMGWWACVSNEKDRNEWNREFSKLLDSVGDDTLLSVFDCHI